MGDLFGDLKAVQSAQAAFAARWQANHPHQVYGGGWRCPLCRYVVQLCDSDHVTMMQMEVWITYHQIGHGRDWGAYAALADQTLGNDEIHLRGASETR